jgi:hypothetical protein
MECVRKWWEIILYWNVWRWVSVVEKQCTECGVVQCWTKQTNDERRTGGNEGQSVVWWWWVERGVEDKPRVCVLYVQKAVCRKQYFTGYPIQKPLPSRTRFFRTLHKHMKRSHVSIMYYCTITYFTILMCFTLESILERLNSVSSFIRTPYQIFSYSECVKEPWRSTCVNLIEVVYYLYIINKYYEIGPIVKEYYNYQNNL